MSPTQDSGSLARRAFFAALARLREGTLAVTDTDGVHRFGTAEGSDPLSATLVVHDPRLYRHFALGGALGAAEAYMDGWWSSDDLVALVRLMVRNLELSDRMESRPARLAGWLLKPLIWLRRNSLTGSRRNIRAHYDLGDELFRLFLDPSMSYSCAIFETPGSSLEEAQRAKIERVCRKLDLRPGEHLLEIGSGWGALAIHAAQQHGCRVTTATISEEQYRAARKRVAAAGLEDRVEVVFCDYRKLEGQYDKLVTIEMIEAVGHRYFEIFFRRCSRLLKPEGLMLMQAITIVDQRYDQARRAVDFIKRYIFPGCCIPSVTALCSAATCGSTLRLVHLEEIGPHYVRTLKLWRERFLEHRDEVLALGYDERFVRMWEYYLAYCEGGFGERYLGDAQMLFAAPRWTREPILPAIERSPQ